MQFKLKTVVACFMAAILCQPAHALTPICKSCKTANMPYDVRIEAGQAAFIAANAVWVKNWRGGRPNKAVDISQKIRESPACFEIMGDGDHRKVFQVDMMGEGRFIGGYSFNKNAAQDNARKGFNSTLNQYCAWIRDMPQLINLIPE